MYEIFKSLTDIAYNFWPWLLIITAPILVFVAKPESNSWLRLFRLILAIIFTHVLIMTILEEERSQSWKNYNRCYESHSELRDMSPERNIACIHHLNKVSDSTAAFAFILGWVPSTGYVGLWEMLWYMRYRKNIKQLGKKYKGKWISTIMITFFVFPGVYSLYITFPILYYVTSVTKDY